MGAGTLFLHEECRKASLCTWFSGTDEPGSTLGPHGQHHPHPCIPRAWLKAQNTDKSPSTIKGRSLPRASMAPPSPAGTQGRGQGSATALQVHRVALRPCIEFLQLAYMIGRETIPDPSVTQRAVQVCTECVLRSRCVPDSALGTGEVLGGGNRYRYLPCEAHIPAVVQGRQQIHLHTDGDPGLMKTHKAGKKKGGGGVRAL